MTKPDNGAVTDEDARGGDPDPTRDPVLVPPPVADPDQLKRAEETLRERAARGSGRQDGLWPYLLIRAFPGDHGVRNPPVGFFWESPDIRVYAGDIPEPDDSLLTLHPTPGQPHTVFVHVWNLGKLPALGTHVRAWWANPSFAFSADSPEPPHFIGGTTVNLGDKTQSDCHALVRIEGTWTPVAENNGHECLLAVASHVMDPGSGWAAASDRHCGQRNLTLAAPGDDLAPLVDHLGTILGLGSDLQVLHGGLDLKPILLAHKAVVGREVVLPSLRDVVVKVPDFAHGHRTTIPDVTPFGRDIGHLGTAVAVPGGGHAVLSAERSVRRIPVGGDLHRFERGGAVDERLRDAAPRSAARAVLETLDLPDLTARSLARAVATSSGDGNLLRFQEVRDGAVVGGYSVIVRE